MSFQIGNAMLLKSIKSCPMIKTENITKTHSMIFILRFVFVFIFANMIHTYLFSERKVFICLGL